MPLISREGYLGQVLRLLRTNRVVALLGARQVGKTTLAKQVANRFAATFFDLENEEDLARLAEPMRALAPLSGLVVLDEVQLRPELFPTLRVLADRPRGARFLVLGSASGDLLQQSSESLAGRIAFLELPPLGPGEVAQKDIDRLWLRGGFPRSFVAPALEVSLQWRQDFIKTFLGRDIPRLGIRIPSPTLQRFWSMLAHVHGQILNWSELGRSMGVTDHTVRGYVDLLAATFMVRQLQPWHENISKRQVKAPKLYLTDSGLLHSLLGIRDQRQLEGHPKVGASWEGFCVDAVARHLGAAERECFFWATHTGAELDLLVVRGNKRLGFEIKFTAAPRLTPSMRSAVSDLKLGRLTVIHAGQHTFPMSEGVMAVAMRDLPHQVKRL
jgi:predicted AAA+ superfamily ATPase